MELLVRLQIDVGGASFITLGSMSDHHGAGWASFHGNFLAWLGGRWHIKVVSCCPMFLSLALESMPGGLTFYDCFWSTQMGGESRSRYSPLVERRALVFRNNRQNTRRGSDWKMGKMRIVTPRFHQDGLFQFASLCLYIDFVLIWESSGSSGSSGNF